jgi:aromatic ring-cleaving dioxygenase
MALQLPSNKTSVDLIHLMHYKRLVTAERRRKEDAKRRAEIVLYNRHNVVIGCHVRPSVRIKFGMGITELCAHELKNTASYLMVSVFETI